MGDIMVLLEIIQLYFTAKKNYVIAILFDYF